MDYQKKLGELLRKERESLDMTLVEVSKKLDFNHYQTLSSIEVGEREVKAFELAKLSQIYGRNIDYFLNLGTLKEKSRILWKSPEQTTQKSLIQRQFLLICRQYHKLMELLGENESTNAPLKFKIDKHELLSESRFRYVEDLASHHSHILNLGSRPACSLSKILEENMGIKVIYLPMVSDISQGCTVDPKFGTAALINENNAPWRRSFDLCCTFFHLLTWNLFTEEEIYQDQIKGESHIEKLANNFAAALLLPEKELRDEFEKQIHENSITYLDFLQVARDFNVPLDSLIQRLVHQGLLDNEKIHEDFEIGNLQDFDKKYRHSHWAETTKPHLSSRYISLAIKAYLSGKITRETLADYVDVSYSSIPAFLRKYGYEENEDYSSKYQTT
ncbi:MAG: helix-turn-helix domain-containing protein [Candidatus Aminicenantes bacterium]|nr:helix-turn-helix domain-containing protein [Candidatus Aminicenantes bacterium]